MFIGYARVSTSEQSLDLQTDALTKAGCERIFTDTAGGAKSERPGLTEALKFMRENDVLVVWKLDRLGRSLKHLIETVLALQNAQKGFRSLQENIDTSTSGGKLFFHIFGALAEFERDIIRDRTKAGLASARSRGRLGGRPPVMDAKKLKMACSFTQTPKLRLPRFVRG
jgi:DNA invertase Pin-like site-specific DNA recombinase